MSDKKRIEKLEEIAQILKKYQTRDSIFGDKKFIWANNFESIAKELLALDKEVEETSDESDKADDEFVESYMTADDEQDKKCESCDVPIPCDMECEQPTAGEILYRWVNTIERQPIEEKYYFVLRGNSNPMNVHSANFAVHFWYNDEKEWSSLTDYWLEEYAQSQKPSRERIIEVLNKYKTYSDPSLKTNCVFEGCFKEVVDELLKPE
jgi:hypothetical protein